MTAEAREMTLADVIFKQQQLERAIANLREVTYDTKQEAEEAHRKIAVLERRMDEINALLIELTKSSVKQGEKIDNFDKKQDVFMSNQMQLVKWFVVIIIAILTVLGGLVGIKLAFPI
ncbi:hypothetical protein KLI54_23305 [Bacillus thuringiensis]|uniref:hypothetical protein n=1 Tax=Bacillus thuringiensis TaxID=1428 RepID=UPI001397C1F0|nr:hypothetical protein [Bacillus thuringiensis]MBT2201168.1 hypothetical protein [Bacillus thuringiensis]BCA37414.1 hypothetical protein BwiPL1_57960 [Bacillus wiedmannii]